MTSRIRLRAMEPEDLDLLYKIENDRQIWNVSNTSVPYSRYVLHDYIANSSGDIYTDREVRLIIENEVGDTVGIIDITRFDAKNLRAEVGLVIANAYRHRGYAAEALHEIICFARQVWHLHQLYAIIDCDNEASYKLFSKGGFSMSSLLKDWLYDGEKYHSTWLMQIFF